MTSSGLLPPVLPMRRFCEKRESAMSGNDTVLNYLNRYFSRLI